jgi:hypothetical protein
MQFHLRGWLFAVNMSVTENILEATLPQMTEVRGGGGIIYICVYIYIYMCVCVCVCVRVCVFVRVRVRAWIDHRDTHKLLYAFPLSTLFL